MNPKTHLRLFCVLLAACLLLPLAAACRQGGEGTGTQTGTHTDSPGTESGSGETTGKPDDPIVPNDTGFSVSRLRVDSQTLPLGLDNAAPLFSWNMTVGQEDTVRGRVQTAYRVLVASDRGLLESGTADMWDSGTVQDGASVNIRYGGAPLLPMTRYFWTVQVTDGNGGMQCAPVAWFETGVGEDRSGGERLQSRRSVLDMADRRRRRRTDPGGHTAFPPRIPAGGREDRCECDPAVYRR